MINIIMNVKIKIAMTIKRNTMITIKNTTDTITIAKIKIVKIDNIMIAMTRIVITNIITIARYFFIFSFSPIC